jgi:hypothetical protein
MKRLFVLAAALITFGALTPASAQTDEHWGLDLGWFASSFNTTLRLDSDELGIGTEIDMEDHLGLESERGDFRLQGFYRFNPRHRIQFGYTRWKRTAERVIEEEIQWGDEIYEVNALVSTSMQADWYKLAYKYSFVHNDSVEVGATFGVSTYDFAARLEASGSVVGGESAAAQVESESLIAPIPMIGMSVDWHISRSFTLVASGEFFDARVSGYDGTMTDTLVGLDWMITPSVGIGAAYNIVSLRVSHDAKADIAMKYSYDGSFAYLKLRF